MIDLTEMSLQDLETLRSALETLRNAGGLLARNGMDPVFLMRPGLPVMIELPQLMKAMPRDEADDAPLVEVAGTEPVIVLQPEIVEAPAAPVVYDDICEAPQVFAAAEAAPADTTTPSNERLTLPRAETGPQPWMEAEIEAVVDIGARALVSGKTLYSAAEKVAIATGRTLAASYKRIKASRAQIELRARQIAERKTEPLPQPEPEAKPEPGAKAAPAAEVMADQQPEPMPAIVEAAAPLDELGSHLAYVAGMEGWTLRDDRDLLHFAVAGWPAHDVAAELGRPVQHIRPRMERLLDKAGRNWPREDVLARLDAMVGGNG